MRLGDEQGTSLPVVCRWRNRNIPCGPLFSRCSRVGDTLSQGSNPAAQDLVPSEGGKSPRNHWCDRNSPAPCHSRRNGTVTGPRQAISPALPVLTQQPKGGVCTVLGMQVTGRSQIPHAAYSRPSPAPAAARTDQKEQVQIEAKCPWRVL